MAPCQLVIYAPLRRDCGGSTVVGEGVLCHPVSYCRISRSNLYEDLEWCDLGLNQ